MLFWYLHKLLVDVCVPTLTFLCKKLLVFVKKIDFRWICTRSTSSEYSDILDSTWSINVVVLPFILMIKSLTCRLCLYGACRCHFYLKETRNEVKVLKSRSFTPFHYFIELSFCWVFTNPIVYLFAVTWWFDVLQRRRCHKKTFNLSYVSFLIFAAVATESIKYPKTPKPQTR